MYGSRPSGCSSAAATFVGLLLRWRVPSRAFVNEQVAGGTPESQ